MSVKYCTRCVYPAVSAAPLTFDEHGVCSGCRVAGEIDRLDWDERRAMLREIADSYRNPSGYDVLIPVGGGKDSYYQTHYAIHELGLISQM